MSEQVRNSGEVTPPSSAPGAAGRPGLSPDAHALLFEKNPQPIWILDMRSLAFLDANPAAEELFGYSRAELSQRTIAHDLSDEDRSRLLKKWKELPAGPSRGVWSILRKDGSRRWIEVITQELPGSDSPRRMVVGRDVSAERETAEALAESEKRYRTLVEVADDAILLTDLEGRHLYANSAYYSSMGVADGHDPNPDGFGSVHPDDRAALRRNLGLIFERGVTMAEYRIKHASGGWMFRSSRSALVRDAEGKPSSIVSILRDITDRKRTEEARQKAERQLHEARKLEALGTLSGGIAHDFNNVLAVMLMDAEELRNRLEPGDERRELADELLASGLRGREMVRRILLFARRQEPSRRIIILQEALPEALQPLRAALPAQVSLEVRIDPATPPTALDATQLYQVVSNLMSNAMHAIGEQGGALSVEAAPAALGASDCVEQPERRPGRYARLTLRDSGAGMTPQTLARIFEPFFTTKSQGQGTGLGLAIVRSIVAAHDGFISVDSAPGQGTAFHIYFPAAAKEQLAAAEAIEPAKPLPSLRLRLLLVDDEELLVRAVTRMLSRRGFEVTAFQRPAEALQLFTAHPDRFDLALVDLAMPEMSGLELSARLIAIRPGFPVLLASGNATGVEPAQAQQAGIRELVAKPYDGNTLLEAVERIIQPPRS